MRRFDEASPEQLTKGERWYEDARSLADTLEAAYGLHPGAGAGIISALSPRVHWNRNVQLAKSVCQGNHVTCLGRSRMHAIAIRHGKKTARTLRGAKTRAFAACILRPTNPWAVCVDVWAARAAGVDPKKLKSKALYAQVAEAYREAAQQRNLPPPTFQAIVWVTCREAASKT